MKFPTANITLTAEWVYKVVERVHPGVHNFRLLTVCGPAAMLCALETVNHTMPNKAGCSQISLLGCPNVLDELCNRGCPSVGDGASRGGFGNPQGHPEASQEQGAS